MSVGPPRRSSPRCSGLRLPKPILTVVLFRPALPTPLGVITLKGRSRDRKSRGKGNLGVPYLTDEEKCVGGGQRSLSVGAVPERRETLLPFVFSQSIRVEGLVSLRKIPRHRVVFVLCPFRILRKGKWDKGGKRESGGSVPLNEGISIITVRPLHFRTSADVLTNPFWV